MKIKSIQTSLDSIEIDQSRYINYFIKSCLQETIDFLDTLNN